MSTCSTCLHFQSMTHSMGEIKVTTVAKTWFRAAQQAEQVTEAFDGTCVLAKLTNVYELWTGGAELPVIGITEGSPMRATGDGCCASLSVKSTFGCDAWEARP